MLSAEVVPFVAYCPLLGVLALAIGLSMLVADIVCGKKR